ncbi:MAG: exosortase family protein XrtF [Sediminicola sp.]
MKALILKYRSVVQFVFLFLGSYLLLSFCYATYLKLSIGGSHHPDFVTHYVARQSTGLISKLGYNAQIIAHETKSQMVLNMDGNYLASIIEGCNSISVIILFIAFIVAFAQGFKKTAYFICVGSLLIYTVNVFRIAILAIGLYHYPHQEKLLHGVVFPGIIYGIVFLLWMLWIKRLAPKKETKDG